MEKCILPRNELWSVRCNFFLLRKVWSSLCFYSSKVLCVCACFKPVLRAACGVEGHTKLLSGRHEAKR